MRMAHAAKERYRSKFDHKLIFQSLSKAVYGKV
jgi:hypothetical protein